MKLFVLSLGIPAALLALQIVAVAFPSPFSHSIFPNVLSTRQSLPTLPLSAIPDPCQSDCVAGVSVINSCSRGQLLDYIGCVCNDPAGNAIVRCSTCLVNIPSVTPEEKAQQQELLDHLTSSCQNVGHPFSKPLKISSSPLSGACSLSPSGAFVFLSIIAGLFAVTV